MTPNKSAFNRVDLVAVLGVLFLLGLLLTPAFARTRAGNHALVCRSNLSRLLNAWRMYAADHAERTPSAGGNTLAWLPNASIGWTGNPYSDGLNQANWNPELTIKQSLLWPYCGGRQDIWRCPGDAGYFCLVTNAPLQGQLPFVRSYSMNGWFNGDSALIFSPGFKLYNRITDCLNPGPARTFVFTHERIDSINDGDFVVSMTGYPNQPGSWRLIDFPACQHDSAGAFSFVDGHAETKRWRDLRTMPPIGRIPLNIPSINNPDVFWLMDHSTRPQ